MNGCMNCFDFIFLSPCMRVETKYEESRRSNAANTLAEKQAIKSSLLCKVEERHMV